MSQTIDNRVVELDFQNQQFEKNAAQSLVTLDKLKDSLDLNNASNNLLALSNASSKFNLNGISEAVEAVGEKFSYMKYAGLVALGNLVDGAVNAGKKMVSALTAPIMSGGWNRAMNLEQANFMMRGLLKTEEEVKAVMNDVSQSVDGTAYSLDAAAKVASQFVASGLKAGETMLPALQAVAGTAAMTNSSFEDIGQIFTTVAGQGKLMTYQMRQLEFRGLNVAATLGEQMGKTEAQIRDMVTKGSISFEMFSDAMYKAFGEHAKEANNTFSGAMSNVRAALGRIGAEFATPFIHNAIPALNAFRLAINAVKATMGPIFTEASSVMELISDMIVTRVNKFTQYIKWNSRNIQVIIGDIISSLKNVFIFLMNIIMPVKEAFQEMFPSVTLAGIKKFSMALLDFTKGLKVSEDAARTLKIFFGGLFSIFDTGVYIVKNVISALKPLYPVVELVGKAVMVLAAYMGYGLLKFNDYIKKSDIIQNIFYKIYSVISIVYTKVNDVWNRLFDGTKIRKEGIISVVQNVVDFIKNAVTKVSEFVKTVLTPGLKGAFSNIPNIFNSILDVIRNVLNGALNSISNFIHSPAFKDLESVFAKGGLMYVMLKTFQSLGKGKFGLTAGLANFNFRLFGNIGEGLINLGDAIKESVNVKMIHELGIALLELAAALVILSGIDSDGLNKAVMAVSQIMTVMVVAVSGLLIVTNMMGRTGTLLAQTINGVKGQLVGSFTGLMDGLKHVATAFALSIKLLAVGSILTRLATAIGILALSVKVLSSVDEDALRRSIAAITILLAEMVGAVVILASLNIEKTAIYIYRGFMKMAEALFIISLALKIVGSMSTGEVIRSVVALGAIFAELALIGKYVASAEGLKSAAGGILLMSGALLVISFALTNLTKHANFEQLLDAIIALSAMLIEMAIVLKKLSSITLTDPAALIKIGGSILIMSIALNIISKALARLSKISIGEMGTAILGLVVGMATMAGALLLLAKVTTKLENVRVTDFLIIGAAFVIVGKAMEKLSIAMKVLSTINIGAMGTAMLGLVVGMATMVGALAGLALVVDKLDGIRVTDFLIIGAAFVIVGIAMEKLSIAMKVLSTINIGEMGTAILGLVVGMATMAGALAGLAYATSELAMINFGELILAAVALVICGKAMEKLAIAIRIMGKVDLPNMAVALGTLAVLFAEMAGALILMGEFGDPLEMLASAAALDVAAIAMGIIAKAIAKLANCDIKGMTRAAIVIGSLTAVLAGLMIALAAISSTGAGTIGVAVAAGAMIALGLAMEAIAGAGYILAAAVGVLADNLKKMEAIDARKLSNILEVLTNTLVKFGKFILIAASISTIFSPALISFVGILSGFGIALNVLGSGLIIISESLAIFTAAIVTLNELGPGFVETVSMLGESIVNLAASLGEGFASGFKAFLETFANSIVEIGKSLHTIIVGLIPTIVDAIALVIERIITSIAQHSANIGTNLVIILRNILNILAENAQPIAEAGADLIIGLANAISEKLPELTDAGMNLLLSFFDAMAAKIIESQPQLEEAFDKLLFAVLNSCKKWTLHFVEVGKDCISGFASGLSGTSAASAAWNLGKKSIEALRDAVDSHSDSKEYAAVGEDSANGFIHTIEDKTPDAENASYNFGLSSINGLTNGVNEGKLTLEGALDGLWSFCENSGGKLEDITSRVADWTTKKSTEVSDALINTSQSLADNEISWEEWEGTVGGSIDVLREYTDQKNALDSAYQQGLIPLNDYQRATEVLDGQIQGIIPNIDKLKSILADLTTTNGSYSLYNLQVRQESITKAMKEGGASAAYLAKEYEANKKILKDYAYITEYGAEKQKAANKATEDGTKKIKDYGDAATGAGKKAKSAKDDIAEFGESLEKTLEGQLNLFDEYKKDDPMNPDQLIKNMEDQINGMTSWAANMTKLSEAGIDKGLYQKLAEMGPQGAKYVDAFASMTAEQLQHANELFATSIQLPSTVSAGIIKDYDNLGKNIVQGEINGINAQTGNLVDAQQNAQEETYTEGAAKPNEVQSPSRLYWRLGMYLMYGLQEGIRDHKQQVLNTMRFFCDELYAVAKTNLDSSKFKEIGSMVSEGLAEGLEANLDRVRSASKALSKIPGSTFTKENDIESPSKLFYSFGRYIDMGLANGIHDYGGLVSDSMEETSNHMVNTMRDTVSRIAQEIQDGVDDPVITPILDLSNVQNGARRLGAMFSTSQAYATAESLGGLQNGKFVGGTTFIQNNYSPKALTRADIYRQTRNQFAQYRQATL